MPCRPTNDSRKVVEGYPVMVARRWIGKRAYKSDERIKQTPDKAAARRDILDALRSPALLAYYACTLEMPETLADTLIQDPTGDHLDALLCAVQAAWAYSQRDNGYGIPPQSDALEGWIVDPGMVNGF